MTKLHDLHEQQQQSPWIDNLTRQAITGGGLAKLRDDGIRGVTSNPTIFQKAISGSDAYDEQFRSLIASESVDDAYWDLVIDDIRHALEIMRPVYDASDGVDGFVSLEVAPALAEDTAGTIERTRHFHDTIAQPNLYVKIPATAQGVPAIQQMVAEGRKINVTLIFSLERYGQVIEAYIAGLEAFSGDLAPVVGVASFFVSRVDTEVDRRLEAIGSPEALALRGKAAVAQAKLAYQLFLGRFSGPRWQALADRGARVQRPLWASTSTKNPAYPDLLYVDSLIGPDTVNTMPDATVAAFDDHGEVRRTIDEGVDDARRVMDDLGKLGIDMEDVASTLEQEGVAAFCKSFDELIQALSDKANALHAG
ncbi:MAG: transaldolase [Actinobacteria bacterium]|nr:transaldolase [Actinomycetota bacterium]MBV9935716.1 transaldolase [Actinomycetota bacterium]